MAEGGVTLTHHADAMYPARDGLTINAIVDSPDSKSLGRVILVPPFGLTMAHMLMAAYFLVVNGFEVVRFDPHWREGPLQGPPRFSPARLVEDLDAVLQAEAGRVTAVAALSISGRAVLRLSDGLPPLRLAALVAPMVDARATLRNVLGNDLVASYLVDGDVPDEISVLGLTLSGQLIRDMVDQDFHQLNRTVQDAAKIAVPTVMVAGDRDEWVALDDVRTVTEAIPKGRLVVVPRGHGLALNPTTMWTYLGALVNELSAAHGGDGARVPRFREFLEFNQRYRKEHAVG